jgi:hypothetical protein
MNLKYKTHHIISSHQNYQGDRLVFPSAEMGEGFSNPLGFGLSPDHSDCEDMTTFSETRDADTDTEPEENTVVCTPDKDESDSVSFVTFPLTHDKSIFDCLEY